MSKEKKNSNSPVDVSTFPEAPAAPSSPVAAPTAPPVPRLQDIDKMALDLAKERRLTALAEAKTAKAALDNSELAFKYTVLQIYMKYGLSEKDAISEDGQIIIGGAVQSQGQ